MFSSLTDRIAQIFVPSRMDVSPQPSGMTDHDNDREIDSGDEEEQDEEFKIRLRKELIMQKDLPEHITEDDFKNYLKSYPNYVREVYDRLETARFKIGDKIPGRKPPHLTRDELIEMDKWMQYVALSPTHILFLFSFIGD